MSSSVASAQNHRTRSRLPDEFRVGSYVVHSPPINHHLQRTSGTSPAAATATLPTQNAQFSSQIPQVDQRSKLSAYQKSPPPVVALPQLQPQSKTRTHFANHLSPRSTAERAMGDRLSTAATTTTAQQQQHRQLPVTNASTCEQSPVSRYVRQTANAINSSNNHLAQVVTPRLPRGISRIPHPTQSTPQQDHSCDRHSPAKGTTDCQMSSTTTTTITKSAISNSSSADQESNISSSSSKYLTFNKDQATSHFKSLREELSGEREKDQKEQQRQVNNSSQNLNTTNHRPSPVERQRNKLLHQSRRSEDRQISLSNNLISSSSNQVSYSQVSDFNNQLAANQQQQVNYSKPICEAFIMTGQSMLKLSCSESSSEQSAAAEEQRRKRLLCQQSEQSVSLNRLNGANNSSANNHKSAEYIAAPEATQPLLTEEQRRRQSDAALTSASQTTTTTQLEQHSSGRGHLSGAGNSTCDRQTASTQTMATSAEQLIVGDNLPSNRSPSPESPQLVIRCRLTEQVVAECDTTTDTAIQVARQISQDSSMTTAGKQQQQQQQSEQLQMSKSDLITGSGSGDLQAGKSEHLQSKGRDEEDDIDRGESELEIGKIDQSEQSKIINDPIRLDQNQEQNSLASNSSNHLSSPNNTTTNNERESAKRLAKRLYNLSGFKRSDVCHHLAKNNPFSHQVATEYLRLFDFRSQKLDIALRKFLSKLQLNGETQERERMLAVFSQRYFDCNREKFPSPEIVQTLVCALILLNTDLHLSSSSSTPFGRKKSKGKRNKTLGLGAFVDGLNSSLTSMSNLQVINSQQQQQVVVEVGVSAGNSNYTFPRHLLVDLYESIRKRPLKCCIDLDEQQQQEKCDKTTSSSTSSLESELADKIYSQQVASNRSNTLPTRRFAPGSQLAGSTLSGNVRRHLKMNLQQQQQQHQLVDANQQTEQVIEFLAGALNRKRIFDATGAPTPKGRRSWRRIYVTLRDLRLVLRFKPPDESADQSGKTTDSKSSKQVAKERALRLAEDMKNTLKLHHSFAKRSTSYLKRDHVFHLKLADQSELLLQTQSDAELNKWCDTINFAAACLSSPALPGAVSSNCNVGSFKRCSSSGNAANKQQHSLSPKTNCRKHRPILPASYTKLSYWEQLIDHEERLQRLKQELDEHLSAAIELTSRSSGSSKHVASAGRKQRVKSEFIEKIAYLKLEIERYSCYVELMRKKSNSPEAIILSKHPQINSLTPSQEMILSLPSFASPHQLEQVVANSSNQNANT